MACLAGTAGARADEGVTSIRHALMIESAATPAPAATPIDLPLHWDVLREGRSGLVELRMAFQRTPGAAAQREPDALFIARLGNAYEIELNGTLLQAAGSRACRWCRLGRLR